MDKKTYYSERGIKLISDIPETITIEDHDKYHQLCYITNDSAIRLDDLYDRKEVFNLNRPNSIVEFAIKHNLKIEYISYAVICYNYLKITKLHVIPNEYLPTFKDLDKVIVESKNKDICSTIYQLYAKNLTKFYIESHFSQGSNGKATRIKYNYAKCVNSHNKFKKGEIYRVSTPYTRNYDYTSYFIINDKFEMSREYYDEEIETGVNDHNFIFILNTDIFNIEIIGKMFDLLEE